MEATSTALTTFFDKISKLPLEPRIQAIVSCLYIIERRLEPYQSDNDFIKINYLKHIFTDHFYKEIQNLPIAEQQKYFKMMDKQPTQPAQLNESEELVATFLSEINMTVYKRGPDAKPRKYVHKATKVYPRPCQFGRMRFPVGPPVRFRRPEIQQRRVTTITYPHRQVNLRDREPYAVIVQRVNASTSGNFRPGSATANERNIDIEQFAASIIQCVLPSSASTPDGNLSSGSANASESEQCNINIQDLTLQDKLQK